MIEQFIATVKEFQKEVHQNSIDKGWWTLYENGTVQPRNPLEIHALIHSEISEATEEARKGTPAIYVKDDTGEPEEFVGMVGIENYMELPVSEKFEGEVVELADAVIRIMDYCESRGWDLGQAIAIKHQYNKTRPHRHGGKKY